MILSENFQPQAIARLQPTLNKIAQNSQNTVQQYKQVIENLTEVQSIHQRAPTSNRCTVDVEGFTAQNCGNAREIIDRTNVPLLPPSVQTRKYLDIAAKHLLEGKAA